MSFEILMTDDRQKNCNGFTLVEVLIAMVIFAIGILGVAQMQISAINGNASARKYNEAAAFAQGQIETLMASNFAGIDNSGASTDSADDGYTIETPQNGYGVRWKVTDFIDLDSNGSDDLKEINVIVQDPMGRERANIDFTKSRDI